MKSYSIVTATIGHVHALGRTMREADANEAKALGGVPRYLLRASYRSSIYTRTAFIGDQIAGMWGLNGDVLGDVGRPWLVTAPIIETMPVAFIREAKHELEAMLYLKPILENYVDASYRKAVRLLEVLGFHVDDPAPYGKRGAMFRRFSVVR